VHWENNNHAETTCLFACYYYRPVQVDRGPENGKEKSHCINHQFDDISAVSSRHQTGRKVSSV
jgi:hypothetical protein